VIFHVDIARRLKADASGKEFLKFIQVVIRDRAQALGV